MPNGEERRVWLESYNNKLNLYKDVNRLLELNDRYNDVLEDIPNPKNSQSVYLDSETQDTQKNYKNFYFIRFRLNRKASKILENEKYGLNSKIAAELTEPEFKLSVILENIINTTEKQIESGKYIRYIQPNRNQLIDATTQWAEDLEGIKDGLGDIIRKSVISESGDTKKNPDIDSQTTSELRSTAAARIKDKALQSISRDLKVSQIIKDRLNQIAEHVNLLGRLDVLIKKVGDSDFVQGISDSNFVQSVGSSKTFNVATNAIKFIFGGPSAVKGQTLSTTDKVYSNFLKNYSTLKYTIKLSEVASDDLDKVDSFWREKVRRRYGRDVPFCDEGRDSSGKWVPVIDRERRDRILAAQKKLLDKLNKSLNDDH